MCTSITNCMDRIFDDKRVAVSVLMVWLTIVMILFKDIGLLDTSFMNFGPSSRRNSWGPFWTRGTSGTWWRYSRW